MSDCLASFPESFSNYFWKSAKPEKKNTVRWEYEVSKQEMKLNYNIK